MRTRRDRGSVAGRRAADGELAAHATTRFTAATTFSDGEAEMLEQHAGRRGLAERVEADDRAAPVVDGPDVLVPAAVEPASTATRGTPGGSTLARYAASCRSKTLVPGIDTTRTATPSAASAARAPIASATSEPVAMITARFAPPPLQSAST